MSKNLNVLCYNKIRFKQFSLSLKNQGDKYCYLRINVLLRVENISVSDGKIRLTGVSLLDPVSFPNYSVNSLELNVYVGNTWSQPTIFSAEEVKMKAVCIPYKDTFCFLPLIHSDR
ncbi:GSCOCG00012505001-RA-CDS [Cotesia congregata]|nr:GSCOCG00012505001-RA-CDS [Cotesia congregata]